jgi:uncharacterized protein YndB with AHSA1/START domain
VTQPATQELQLKRLIDAPREAVFRAWTDPEHVKRWWGPIGMATTTAEIDLRTGGAYRLVMSPPDDGMALAVTGTYREVTPPSRLVYTWQWENGVPDALQTLVTVEFNEQGAQTEIVITHGGFPSDGVLPSYQVGWEETLARLAALGPRIA